MTLGAVRPSEALLSLVLCSDHIGRQWQKLMEREQSKVLLSHVSLTHSTLGAECISCRVFFNIPVILT